MARLVKFVLSLSHQWFLVCMAVRDTLALKTLVFLFFSRLSFLARQPAQGTFIVRPAFVQPSDDFVWRRWSRGSRLRWVPPSSREGSCPPRQPPSPLDKGWRSKRSRHRIVWQRIDVMVREIKKRYIEHESRRLPGEYCTKFMESLHEVRF